MIFRKTRAAYGGGFRAGLAGASSHTCDYSMFEFMQCIAWYCGFQVGLAKRLNITKGVEK